MAALMRDWLAETVENALRGALQWKRAQSGIKLYDENQSTTQISGERRRLVEPPSTQTSGGSERKYRDNGSNLRITCPADGSTATNVQLLKFISFESPIKALLSDGTTRIHVKFSNAAVDAYSDLNKKPFTQDTKGGVLALKAFDVVLSLVEVSEEEQITLLIRDFYFGGLGGSSTWYEPGAIERRVSVRDMLRELQRALRTIRDESVNEGKGTKAALSPNQGTNALETVSREDTGVIEPPPTQPLTHFASQARDFKPSSIVRDLSLAGGTNLARPTEPRRTVVPQQDGPSETVRSGNELLKMLKNISKSNSALPAKNVAHSKPLMSVISKEEGDGAETASIKLETNNALRTGTTGRQSISGAITAPIEISDSSGEEEAASSVLLHESSTRVNKFAEDAVTIAKENHVPAINRESAHLQPSPALPASAPFVVSENEKKQCNSPDHTDTILPAIVSSGVGKVNSGNTKNVLSGTNIRPHSSASSSKISSLEQKYDHHPTSSTKVDPDAPQAGSTFFHQANFNYVSRLAIADSTLPAQAKLLSLPESWQHPEPGLQFPSPNIPIEILKALNASADKRARARSQIPGDNNPAAESSSNNPAMGQQRDGFEGDHLVGGRRLSSQSITSKHSVDSESYSWASSPPQAAPSRQPRNSLPPDSSADMSPSKATKVTESMSLRDTHMAHEHPNLNPESPERILHNEQIADASADLPDDSSDLEMAESQALPPITTSSNPSRGQNGLTIATTPTSGRKWRGPSSELLSSPGSGIRKTNHISPFFQSNASASARTLPSSEPVIPGTFRSDLLESYSHARPIPAVDGTSESDPPEHVSASLIEQQLQQDMTASHGDIRHISTNLRSSKSTNSNVTIEPTSAGNPIKRKAEEITPSAGRLPDTKRTRHKTGLDHASQVLVHPVLAWKNAKADFVRNRPQDQLLRAPTLENHRLIQTTPPPLSADNIIEQEFVGKSSPSLGYQRPTPRTGSTAFATNGQVTTPRATWSTSTGSPSRRTYSQRISNDHSTPDNSRRSAAPTTNEVTATAELESHASIAPRMSTARNYRGDHPTGSRHAIFEAFKCAYQAYTGNHKHFLGLCRKIKSLSESDRPLHQFLWDDFIVRHKTEYISYAMKCTEEGGEAAPYEKYYHDEIRSPLHIAGIIDPMSLREALSEVNASTNRTTSAQSNHGEQRDPCRESSRTTFSQSCSRSSSIGRPNIPSRHDSLRDVSPPQREREMQGPGLRLTQRGDSYRPAYDRSSHRRVEGIGIGGTPSSHEQGPAGTEQPRRSLPWSTQSRTSKQSLSSVTSLKSMQPEREAHGRKATDMPNPIAAGTDDRTSAAAMALPKHLSRTNTSSRAKSAKKVSTDRENNEKIPSQMPWWTNDDTPFKDFTRHYAKLKIHDGALGVPGENSVLYKKAKQLNVLNWHL